MTAWQLLRTWIAIGVQSVGGGSTTLYLMRRAFVERAPSIPMREFMEYWAVSRVSPLGSTSSRQGSGMLTYREAHHREAP